MLEQRLTCLREAGKVLYEVMLSHLQLCDMSHRSREQLRGHDYWYQHRLAPPSPWDPNKRLHAVLLRVVQAAFDESAKRVILTF